MKFLYSLLFLPFLGAAQLNPAFVAKSNLNYTKMQSSSEGMYGFEQNGKIGYIDKNGLIVVPAIYSYDSIGTTYGTIPYFSNDYVKIVQNKKAGMIDKKGKLVIPIEYENLTPYIGFGNFVLITKTIGGKKNYGVLTAKNEVLLPVEYEEIRIDTGVILAKQNAKWGVFDKAGKQIIPLEYTTLSYSPTDKVLLAEKGTQYGLIDIKGNWLFEKAKNVYTLYAPKYGMVQCRVSGKYGFLDLKGNEVIVTRYDGVYDFGSNGLAMVYKKKDGASYTNLFGYIDKKGTEVIPLKFESLSAFNNGLCYGKDPETNRYGYMDKTGKWVLQPVYLSAGQFDDFGGACVKMTDDKYHYINKAGKDLGMLDAKGANYFSFDKYGYSLHENADYDYTIIDKTGKLIKKIDSCETVYSFSDGMAGFKNKSNSKFGFIDINGNKIVPPVYDNFGAFSEGVAAVSKKTDNKTKNGYINNKGDIILPALYDATGSFRNGWGLVKKDSIYFFVDRNGNLKDPPRKYNELYEFRSGYALGKINGTGTDPHTYYYINTQLKEEFSVQAKQAYLFWDDIAIISKDNVTYEMMNKKGEVFKKLTDIETLKFSSDGLLAVREKGKWGYINNSGDVIVQPKYDSCEVFKYGYGRVKKAGKWGIVDKSGTEIIEPKYENILPGENGLFIFFDKYWGVMDKTGKILIQQTYLTMNPYEKDRAMARQGKIYTLLKSPLAK